MLSIQENEKLTRVGKGTPMGEFLRRFWVPALLSEELPSNDCPPVRVKLFGENLVAFRNTSGKVGLVQGYCAHRQMDLFYGRNEDEGLRCVYHGWKYDLEGRCVDMPSEPEESNFRDKVSITAYPCREAGGLIWAYLGPKDFPASFPEFESNYLPKENMFVRKNLLEANFLQTMEGNLDSTHIGFLHRVFTSHNDGPSVGGILTLSSSDTVRDSLPRYELKDTDFGMMVGARRPRTDGSSYWRITQWALPFYTMIANDVGETLLWDAWVPIDDENTWVYRVQYNPWRAMRPEEVYEFDTVGFMDLRDRMIPGTYRPVRNKHNNYLIDRELQRSFSYSGIKGNNPQDAAAVENQGPGTTTDRSKERLGTSDTAIIAARRRLLRILRDLEEGLEPLAAQRGDLYKVRPIAVVLKDDVPFHEGAKEHMFV